MNKLLHCAILIVLVVSLTACSAGIYPKATPLSENAPFVEVGCSPTGLSSVSIAERHPFDNLYMTISRIGGPEVMFAHYAQYLEGSSDTIFGGIADIRNSTSIDFTPGEYVVRGYEYPNVSANSYPELGQSGLVFETEPFLIQICQPQNPYKVGTF